LDDCLEPPIDENIGKNFEQPMIEEGIQNVVDSLQGISLSDIESENANEAKEDER